MVTAKETREKFKEYNTNIIDNYISSILNNIQPSSFYTGEEGYCSSYCRYFKCPYFIFYDVKIKLLKLGYKVHETPFRNGIYVEFFLEW